MKSAQIVSEFDRFLSQERLIVDAELGNTCFQKRWPFYRRLLQRTRLKAARKTYELESLYCDQQRTFVTLSKINSIQKSLVISFWSVVCFVMRRHHFSDVFVIPEIRYEKISQSEYVYSQIEPVLEKLPSGNKYLLLDIGPAPSKKPTSTEVAYLNVYIFIFLIRRFCKIFQFTGKFLNLSLETRLVQFFGIKDMLPASVLLGVYWEKAAEKGLYKLIFKIAAIRNNRLFFLNNGELSSLCMAADELGLQSVELQHGLISLQDSAYSYAPSHGWLLDRSFPDLIALLEERWAEHYQTGAKHFVIGDFMNMFVGRQREINVDSDIRSVVLISSGAEYFQSLVVLGQKLLAVDSQLEIVYRPRPDEQLNQREIFSLDRLGIKVHKGSREELFNFDLVIGINSTLMVELSSSGLPILILKYGSYFELDTRILSSWWEYICTSSSLEDISRMLKRVQSGKKRSDIKSDAPLFDIEVLLDDRSKVK